ncbi:MAG: hypothetical protein NCW75_02390 [Phycisphaera sp.]|nr:MAG: hypothetical protein NCW75_02390 [Phycisphaera sp.]
MRIKLLFCVIVGVGLALFTGCVSDPERADGARQADPQSLVGRWRVDLRPTPDAEAYYQSFVVDSVEERTFTGTFYGSPISEARLNADWGDVAFSFVTSDGSGPYLHSGILRGGVLEGMSNSTGRGFLSIWRAEREE